jgi:hypothetical protein
MKGLQFNLTVDKEALQTKLRMVFDYPRCRKVVYCKVIKKISKSIFAFICVFQYNDIDDALLLVNLKLYLELEPVLEIFGKIFKIIRQNQLFPESFIVYFVYTTRILT